MDDVGNIGVYGKLPAYGDFVSRNLSLSYIEPWDEWLQNYVATSKEQIGEQWLDIYLTSPIWRFVLSRGVIDDSVWAGVIMPSVDRVGRYFPISLSRQLPKETSPVGFFASQAHWFQQIEHFCLQALDAEIDVDELIFSVDDIGLTSIGIYTPTAQLGENGGFVIGLPSCERAINESLPYALDVALSGSFSSFSVWQTAGSESVSPMMFCCQGLPPISGITSMLDGQWQLRNWKIPYDLKT